MDSMEGSVPAHALLTNASLADHAQGSLCISIEHTARSPERFLARARRAFG